MTVTLVLIRLYPQADDGLCWLRQDILWLARERVYLRVAQTTQSALHGLWRGRLTVIAQCQPRISGRARNNDGEYGCPTMMERRLGFIVCCVVLAQGCADRGTRLASKDTPAPFEQVLRQEVSFQIPEPETVWGVGIVANLPGTGSGVCPPQVRSKLRRMMSSSYTEGIDLEAFIRSPNTAVVTVEGQIPGSAIKSDSFDIQVKAYDNSGRCSLAGGWLYRTDLALTSNASNTMLQAVATAEGALFKPIEQRQTRPSHTGYVLGGGRVVAETATHLILNEPGFKQASLVRNMINARFGMGTARAVSPGQVDVRVPAQYRQDRWRFWAVVEALPMADTQEALDRRLEALIQQLVSRQDVDDAEISLEAMGQSCVPLLTPHLHRDPEVSLAAARCLSNLGGSSGLSTLAQIAENPQSPLRVQAMHALKSMTKAPQISQFVARLLGDADFQFAMDVYESLSMKDGVGAERETVAGAFTLDIIAQSRTQAVIATRSGGAHVALFGSPIRLKPGQIIEFSQKKIKVDSRSDTTFVLISRSSASQSKARAPVQCSYQLRDIIHVLCKKRGLGGDDEGFGLSYDELLGFIGQLADQGMIPASFWAGPLLDLP